MMRSVRLRDTAFYVMAVGLAFCILFYSVHVHFQYWNYLLLFIYSLIDTLVFEEARDIYRLSRMQVFMNWFLRSFILYGILRYIFSFDLRVPDWLLFFSMVGLVKLVILTWSSHRLKSGRIYYDTLLIGSGPKANHLVNYLHHKTPSMGQNFIGYVGQENILGLIRLGNYADVEHILQSSPADEVIVALEENEYSTLNEILSKLRSIPSHMMIRITPESYDYLMGNIKLDAVYGEPLIELPLGSMRLWKIWMKRMLDVIVSIIVLVFLFPFIVLIAIATKNSSPGPILYSQSRIGRFGKSFTIFKFRSMFVNAEDQSGPALSYDGDSRCTPWGLKMRKWRLDEIPQFWNVLKGDMSIVGPRPEREFFIKQIVNVAPYYPRILTVRPGITSWGQVKFGYASNIDQMVERLKFDLIYIENQSLTLDIKIILYTILVLFQGKGK